MRVVLCEKPSQGKDIARVLGAHQREAGCLAGPGIKVTWGIGHLIEAAPPEAYGEHYQRWSLETLPIVPQQWRWVVKADTASQFKVVQRLLAQASELIIATDADREGEMIARELVEYCGYRGPIQRLWLSALNDASIRKALGSLRASHETFPLYHCALARSHADWLVGINLTRLFTLLGRKAGFDGVLSVGRVQTPTLKLVIDRDREIAAFVPVPFWSIEVSLSAGEQAFSAHWAPPAAVADDAGRCVQQSAAQHAAAAIRTAGHAQVTGIDTERVQEGPPLPFDLSTLQEVCSRRLCLDVQETLDIAQALYETHKATTYPRTDAGYLPENMLAEVPTVIQSLLKTDPALQPLIQHLDVGQRSRAWNDAKIAAHHAIIPTLEPANLSAMSEKELAVYRLIRAHYLAQFLPHHVYDRTTVRLACGGQALQASGKQVIDAGWKLAFSAPSLPDAVTEAPEAETDSEAPRDQALPALREGMACQVRSLDLKSLHTKAPPPYTQGELVKAMKTVAKLVTDPRLKQTLRETTGIGTEATRANIISGLLARGFLERKGRAVRASETSMTLIDAVPSAIADPGTTAIWEQALHMIEARKMDLESFVSKQAAWVSQLVEQHREATLAIRIPAGPPCPRCGAVTRQRTGKTGAFWSCSRYPDCKGTVAIDSAKSGPRNGLRKPRPARKHG